MFLFLYPKNQITCYFFFWLLHIRTYSFMLPSYAVILFWLCWDVYGALRGGEGIAYTAHLGGFTAGFLTAFVFCKLGWVTLWEREESLLDLWRTKRESPSKSNDSRVNGDDTRLTTKAEVSVSPDATPQATASAIPLDFGNRDSALFGDPSLECIRFACACGHRIKVPRKLAGQSGRCTKCQAVVQIPSAQDTDRVQAKRHRLTHVIRFACKCGKAIKVQAKYAGHSGICPKCSARVRVPSLDSLT